MTGLLFGSFAFIIERTPQPIKSKTKMAGRTSVIEVKHVIWHLRKENMFRIFKRGNSWLIKKGLAPQVKIFALIFSALLRKKSENFSKALSLTISLWHLGQIHILVTWRKYKSSCEVLGPMQNPGDDDGREESSPRNETDPNLQDGSDDAEEDSGATASHYKEVWDVYLLWFCFLTLLLF